MGASPGRQLAEQDRSRRLGKPALCSPSPGGGRAQRENSGVGGHQDVATAGTREVQVGRSACQHRAERLTEVSTLQGRTGPESRPEGPHNVDGLAAAEREQGWTVSVVSV